LVLTSLQLVNRIIDYSGTKIHHCNGCRLDIQRLQSIMSSSLFSTWFAEQDDEMQATEKQ